MKKLVKKTISKIVDNTINRPLWVQHCSQTLYQSALGCIRMWDETGDLKWQLRAEKVVHLILESQQPDGGFDIGYRFNFGYPHKVGESTSPELPGLLALAEYLSKQADPQTLAAAERAMSWIERFAFKTEVNGEWAIPYGPYSSIDVVNYNGVSFACGALGKYLSVFGGSERQKEMYSGFVRYLQRVSSTSEEYPGCFWYYADQEDPNISESQKGKIDFYHQMQQVEMHSIAERVLSAPGQLQLVQGAADHIVAYYNKHGFVPYTPCGQYFGGHIHTWGYCSVASGLLEAASLLPDRSEEYREVASEVGSWLMENAYRDGSFIPVITTGGVSVDSNSYVRTDAWVFNTMCALEMYLGSGVWTSAIDPVWERMKKADFSGPENHARPRSGKLFFSALKSIRRMTKSSG